MNVSFIVMLSCGTVTIVTIVTPARHTHLKFVSIINWISSEGLDRMEMLWREEGLISTVINSRYLQMLVKTLKCCSWWCGQVRWGDHVTSWVGLLPALPQDTARHHLEMGSAVTSTSLLQRQGAATRTIHCSSHFTIISDVMYTV